MATIPAETSSVSTETTTPGRCGSILLSFLNVP
jgi:hypothetical protein